MCFLMQQYLLHLIGTSGKDKGKQVCSGKLAQIRVTCLQGEGKAETWFWEQFELIQMVLALLWRCRMLNGASLFFLELQ